MILKRVALERNPCRFARSLRSLGQFAGALAIAIGWLALVALLSHGGAYLAQIFGLAPPVDVDLPLTDPGYNREMAIDSALALGCCAAVVALLDLLWRRCCRGAR